MTPLGDFAAKSRSAEGVYLALAQDGSEAVKARTLVALRHWLHEVAAWDERTGEALPRSLSEIADVLATAPENPVPVKDRFQHILEHVREPLLGLCRQPLERLARERAILPFRAVRELDTASFAALGRRPGRTIREKLSGHPHMLAPRRRGTLDTLENRLLKGLCERLVPLLELRVAGFGAAELSENTELLEVIRAWLRSPAAEDIGRWENHPPNNALLQHAGYRRLWNGWLWMQSLDEGLGRDAREDRLRWASALFWKIVGYLHRSAQIRFPEQPCYFDYETCLIRPGLSGAGTFSTIEGLQLPSLPSGRSRGRVSMLGVDKTKLGYGRVSTSRGESAFFHSRSLRSPSEFSRLTKGSVLTYKIKQTENGLVALDVELAQAAHSFRLDLSHEAVVSLVIENRPVLSVMTHLPAEGAYPLAVCGQIKREATEAALISFAERVCAKLLDSGASGYERAPDGVPRPGKYAAIELSGLRPRFEDDRGSGRLPFRCLWQRWQQPGESTVEISLPHACLVALHPQAETVSILNLLGHGGAKPLPEALLGPAARSFAAQTRRFLETEALIYLVPDAADDFSLDTLRKGLNFRFSKAEPLPRSIASVFSWQASSDFARTAVRAGDCVWVLDPAGASLALTPLIASHSRELATRVPETGGIFWERCPTLLRESPWSSVEAARRLLEAWHCPFAESIARLCEHQGLLDERENLSWIGPEDEWFTPPEEGPNQPPEVPRQDFWGTAASHISRDIQQLPRDAMIHILPVGYGISAERLGDPPVSLLGNRAFKWHAPLRVIAKGGAIFCRWRGVAGEIPLWRDRLPELSVRVLENGRMRLFHLVKDVTLSPRRGVPEPIPISETFVLPAGMEYYQFPLLQGEAGNELQYEAFLRSPAFPLAKDAPCRLEMTFTYGDDEPYRLKFVPLNPDQGFASIQARWQLKTETTATEAAFPAFPATPSWDDLRRWPALENGGVKDLLAWAGDGLGWLALELQKIRQRRHAGTIAAQWRRDRNDELYTFATCHAGSVFCHAREFVENFDPNALTVGQPVTFEIAENRDGKLTALWISSGENAGPEATHALTQERLRRVEKARDLMRRALRFPFRTIWAGGRSLSDPDAPGSFRETMHNGLETLEGLRTLPLPPDPAEAGLLMEVADEALFLLCCMHRDAPPHTRQHLIEALQEPSDSSELLRKYFPHFAVSLGAAGTEWQRSLLALILQTLHSGDGRMKSICLRILAVALWRESQLLEQLPHAELNHIVAMLAQALEVDARRITRPLQPQDQRALQNHLELLLGLLRTRASAEPEIHAVLAPRAQLTERVARIIDRIADGLGRHPWEMRSRIRITVQKPPSLHNTPDLLYALQLYLTGDSAARAIQVTAVSDDD